ncbi:WhiB family transcriptional regulator [Rhodococcus pyridinivorans KG-16]|jgi:WhiB family redox-sensing transcriptional regulator|uniref:Transcriptional regulator WhiB n=1 Tax=Rhodococcus pyridinivorans KG-16 TaxID=1441730 RepID=A0A0V9UPY0_9NOCA|nr:WhiB family transcriptional regulator [Rhodococcus pyridinivorans]KSZ60056.1 WhiB family transcriptional regulator [Rhodococcus pyridinivorans KG-16]
MPALKLLYLPPPVAEEWDWQMGAACRDADGSLFFHPDNERGDARESRMASAKKVCARCPVREKCLQYALDSGERYGIWGGLTEDERTRVRRARRHRTSR